MFETVHAAVAASLGGTVRTDPELTEAIQASNRANLAHWATANVAAPGSPVLVNRGEETFGLVRILARRGIEDISRVAYSAGQNAAWSVWMRAVFGVTGDAGELQAVLEMSAESVSDFVARMHELLRREIERERGLILSAENVRRLGIVNRLLRSGVSPGLAEELRYPIDVSAQTAVVLWAVNGSAALPALIDRVAGAVGPRLSRAPLVVLADVDTAWAWFASDDLRGPIDRLLERTFSDLKSSPVRVAIGPTRPGYDGFREGHGDAVAAAEVAHHDVVRYADVVLATLVRGDPERARTFILERVGGLEEELKPALAAYLANRCSATRTAQATAIHRNTVIDRVRRAEAQLRVPLAGNELEIALALELEGSFGPRRARS